MGGSCGDRSTRVTRSTNTGPMLSPRARHRRRAEALRFVAETILSEEEEEQEEEEDLCSHILSSFINNLDDRQWESIRDRMREPLTQAHLAKVSRSMVRVVSQLVLQMLVPALMDRLQARDAPEASASKSCREETQSKDSRSSPVMVKPHVEEPLQMYFGASQESLAESLGDEVQQANQGLPVFFVYTPLPEAGDCTGTVLQAQEQVAENMSLSCALAETASLEYFEQLLELAIEEVVAAIIKSLDRCEEKAEAGVKKESIARKILKNLDIKMRLLESTKLETQGSIRMDTDGVDSLDDSGIGYCGCFGYLQATLQSCISKVRAAFKKSQKDETPGEANPEVRDGSALQGNEETYPITVSPEEVFKTLLCGRFHRTSLNELEDVLSSLFMFSSESFRTVDTSAEPNMASLELLASEMVDTVVNSINKLCQPKPRKVTLPWQRSESTTVTEDQVASAALGLKLNLREKLRNFFNFHKEALDKPREDEKDGRASSAVPHDRSDPTDIQEGTDVHSIRGTAAGSSGSSVNSVAGEENCLADETEQSLKQGSSGVQTLSGDTAPARLEELISQDKLAAFAKILADKVTGMFHQQEQSVTKPLDPSRKAWSETDLTKPPGGPTDSIADQMYLFVEEAVKGLLTLVFFPPPSWRMGHVIQVQSGASSAVKWEESTKKYEAAIDDYSQLMTEQVMGCLGRTSAASRRRQEEGSVSSGDVQDRKARDGVAEPKNIIHVFQDLPNKIRKKWRILTNKEV